MSVYILDFGSQYSHLIARRVRESKVYCELNACTMSAAELEAKIADIDVKCIILSGGPSSVYEEGAPHLSDEMWALFAAKELPVLGICYGLQEMTNHFGGTVESAEHREFGHAQLTVGTGEGAALFADLDADLQVWMSHGDKLTALPAGFAPVASTPSCEFAAIANPAAKMYGLQFHPEVNHTPQGALMLRNFVLTIGGCSPTWGMDSFADEAIRRIREQVGPTGMVLGAVSGGVDSSVAALLLSKAIGDRFHAVLVDNGLMRLDECRKVVIRMRDQCGINLSLVDAADLFLAKLAGVEDPERKRKIIGATFIEVFEKKAAELKAEFGSFDFLMQGTLYPDVIESVSFKGPSATIKSHHNVGGLVDNMRMDVVEPLRELFKDEVRALGEKMGMPHESVWRHPFPGPGLAIRILAPITKEGCDKLRAADAIYLEELYSSGHYDKIAQAFAVLLPCKSVGVMGDCRTYEEVCVLRAVETSDYMTAGWYKMPYDLLAKISSRIINEVKGINRVTYDISTKPPATIEWL